MAKFSMICEGSSTKSQYTLVPLMLWKRVLANMPCNACPNSCRKVFTSENVSRGRLVFGWFGEIHGDGHMRTAVASVVVYPLFLVASHPGTRTLALAGMEVCVEYSQKNFRRGRTPHTPVRPDDIPEFLCFP